MRVILLWCVHGLVLAVEKLIQAVIFVNGYLAAFFGIKYWLRERLFRNRKGLSGTSAAHTGDTTLPIVVARIGVAARG